MENEAKKKTIQDAYGEYWDKVHKHIDENGWLTPHYDYKESITKLSHDFKENSNFGEGYYDSRPKSLNGIESNNGWIKIESENDLPKEDCKCWVITVYGSQFMSLFILETNKFWELDNLDFKLLATHYQPIITPPKPIY